MAGGARRGPAWAPAPSQVAGRDRAGHHLSLPSLAMLSLSATASPTSRAIVRSTAASAQVRPSAAPRPATQRPVTRRGIVMSSGAKQGAETMRDVSCARDTGSHGRRAAAGGDRGADVSPSSAARNSLGHTPALSRSSPSHYHACREPVRWPRRSPTRPTAPWRARRRRGPTCATVWLTPRLAPRCVATAGAAALGAG